MLTCSGMRLSAVLAALVHGVCQATTMLNCGNLDVGGVQGEGAGEQQRCRYRVLPATALAASLDMRQEVMETLLSYLEVRRSH